MRSLIMLAALLFSSFAFAGVQGLQGSQNLGIFTKVQCSTGMTCTKLGDALLVKSLNSAPFTQVAATATTITAAQCGSTFYNSGAVLMNLPATAGILGCQFTFVTLNASNFDVNPANADTILALTNAAGDAIRNATAGNSITLQAMPGNQWVATSVNGTYTDIN